jgi:predicted nucleic acid-binding protein
MFVDTNVLVRARIDGAPNHEIAQARLDFGLDSGEVSISRQIIRECLAVVTRPQAWSPPLSMTDALDDVLWMLNTFQILSDGSAVTNRLITLCREVPVGGRQIHDANIVATMLAHGERRLLTFNASDFRRYGSRIELVEG